MLIRGLNSILSSAIYLKGFFWTVWEKQQFFSPRGMELGGGGGGGGRQAICQQQLLKQTGLKFKGSGTKNVTVTDQSLRTKEHFSSTI